MNRIATIAMPAFIVCWIAIVWIAVLSVLPAIREALSARDVEELARLYFLSGCGFLCMVKALIVGMDYLEDIEAQKREHAGNQDWQKK